MDAPNEGRGGANDSLIMRSAGYLWSWVPGFVRTSFCLVLTSSFQLKLLLTDTLCLF